MKKNVLSDAELVNTRINRNREFMNTSIILGRIFTASADQMTHALGLEVPIA
jgi:hypothetical protein